MATLYNIIEFLCTRDGIKPGKLCAEIGISRGVLSDLKAGRSKSLSLATMQKIANYFQVSTDIFNEGVIEETLPNAADMEHLRETLLKDALFNKKAPTPVSEDRLNTERKQFSLEESNRFLVAMGFIKEGQDLSDDDLAFLTHIIGLLNNHFSKRGYGEEKNAPKGAENFQ